MMGENLPFTYFVSIGFFLSFTIFYITAFCWRRKRSVSTLLYQDQHIATYEGIHYVYYIVRVTTSCLPYSGCRRLRNLHVTLKGTKRNCWGNVFSPSKNLFMRGSTDLLVMSSMKDIGDVVGVDFELAFSGINKKSSVWTLTTVEVFCCKTHARYHMEKCLKFDLPVGVDQKRIHVDLIPGGLKPSFRCFPQVLNEILDYHLWMFGKYHHGEFKPHDNIMLLFLVMSLSMVSNFFVLYLNSKTSDFDHSFSLTIMLLLWSQVFNVAIFLLSCCCEMFLRNVRMKEKGKKDEFIFSPEPGQEYIYFGKLLHRIYINLGLHHCDDMMSSDTNNILDLRDKRPKSRKNSKTQLFIPEILKPYNISHLIDGWETELVEMPACRLCRMNHHIDVFKKDESFSLLYSLAPFIKLEVMSSAVVQGDDFCVPFDCATDLYTETDKSLEKNRYSLKIAKKFVDSLMCVLQLFKMVYVDDLELSEILTIFNVYKSCAYEILHHHVHELLTSEEETRRRSLSIKQSCSLSRYPMKKIEKSILTDMNSLAVNLDKQNRKFRKVSFSAPDSTLLALPDTQATNISRERPLDHVQRANSRKLNTVTAQNNLRVVDNRRWRMLHWRSDLDDIVNILLDSIVLISPKEHTLNNQEMELKGERIETILLYTEELILNCTWLNDMCNSCINAAVFEPSPWRIPRMNTIEEHVVIKDLSRNFQAFYLSREIMIEKVINKVEDVIFYDLINLVFKESQQLLPVPYLELTTLELTNQAIVEATEELSIEKDYPVFSLSRLAFFVTVAKFLNKNRDYIARCPTLVGFLEVSRTDLDQSENMRLSLAEIIFYEMSQSIFKILSPRKTKWPQKLFEKSLVEGLCQRVLTETQDEITALTLDFLMDIMNNRKKLKKQNLTSMYVSASLDNFSEQQYCLIKNTLNEFLEWKEFSDLGNEQAFQRRKNLFKEKATQTKTKKAEVKIGIDLDIGTDVGKDTVHPKSFLEVQEQELGLPRSYLSILSMLTYRVWFQDEHSKNSDEFLWQFYSAYFQDNKKPLPYWTKTIIQIFIMFLMMSGFIYLPFNEKLLKGTAMKEWCVLFLLSLVVNVLIFESLKVAAIWIYQHYFQKEKEKAEEI